MIRKGLLLPDSEPVGVGINDARRGIADMGDGHIKVIFKLIPDEEFAAELFCGLLATELNLPAPEPLILFDPATGNMLFGSADMEYPNALRAFNIDKNNPDESLVKFLTHAINAWPKAKEVTVFDEWIHNKDRNLENLLFAGAEEFAIIDHGKALDIDVAYRSNNHLCTILSNSCYDEKARKLLLKSMKRLAASFDMLYAESPRASLESNGIMSHTAHVERFYTMIEDRLSVLAVLLQNRMPGQHGLMIEDTT
jgi:hypothetical protein